ncbi:MAG: OB-fold domain-containing protein [Pleurocapsa minor GSE-CHR-MK-17-07R]|nr:OB-fold domain-containing protein [Pleurocapsa minor GSE-CHR-MK 17-07R]
MANTRKEVEVQAERFAFSGRGEVYSFTTVQEPPAGYEDQSPYVIGLIRLEDGPLVTAQITDLDDQPLAIGDRVEMVTRKLTSEGERGMIVYGYKFRKVLQRA